MYHFGLRQLRHYGVDITTLSETWFSEQGLLVEVSEGYTFFWKGQPAGSLHTCMYSVGFAIHSSLLPSFPESSVGISKHLMSLHIPLVHGRFAMLSVYVPTIN